MLGPEFATYAFIAVSVGYVWLMRSQVKLREGERIAYRENKVRCVLREGGARLWNMRDVVVTNKRVIEKQLGFCLRSVTLGPHIREKFGFINVVRGDHTGVASDEKGEACLQAKTANGIIIRWYFRNPMALRAALGSGRSI